MKKRKPVRVPSQRLMHLSLPLVAHDRLVAYVSQNGCQNPTAIAIAVDRFFRLPLVPMPASLEKCSSIRTDGKACHRCRLPGQSTCSAHGNEYVRHVIPLPLELQSKVDAWVADGEDYAVTANLLVAVAITTCLN